MLAYLKYYSENPMKVGETESPIIEEYLTKLINQGIYMSFFKNFLDERGIELSRFSDKTIIEYKTDPGKRVFIHYIIEGDDEENGEYVTEEMRDMYGGVHAKAFVLFFGENLLYYITEENDEGEEFLTESASIQKSDISREIADSCFNAINDIVIAKTLRDYDTVDNLLYDYYKHDHVVKNMFTIL
jgi:predicted transcriptional regulator